MCCIFLIGVKKKMEDQKYLTVSEVANHFRVTSATVLNWIKGGALMAIQVGGVWRIPESSIGKIIKLSNSN